jgi:sulfide:quinone oxidoreductase
VIALPRLRGPRLGGVPQTSEGFVPVDPHGRVPGLPGVFAAGDLTAHPVKQGGLAAQQAIAAAEAIAAAAGASVTPRPFRPVLRALLLTGKEPLYLRAALTPGGAERSEATTDPLWSPPAKIIGHYLAPFLASSDDVCSAPALPANDVLKDPSR